MVQTSRRVFLKLAGASAVTAGIAGWLGWPLGEAVGREMPKTTSPATWSPTVCRICPAGCGMLARVIDGKVVKVEGNPRHPLNQGKLCPRAQAATQVLYDPDRIQGPLRRIGERGEGRWEPVSWDEAITQIAGRLKELQAQKQARTLLFLHDAPPGQMQDLISLFCQSYGSPNVVSADRLDAERLAHFLTQGWFDLAAHDWEETAYAIFFGGSFLEDWQPQTHMLRGYSHMRRGRPDRRARIVQVGPRFSVSAAKSDEWVPLLPGRHGALALGMAHVIIRERLYDHNFIAGHTDGFDEFAALVKQHTPETASGLSGVPVETIERLAREFAGNRPAVAVAGRGLEEGDNALFNHLAIHALNALVGSVDAPGGTLRPRKPTFTPWGDVEKPAAPRLDGAGTVAYPLALNSFHALPERIQAGEPYAPQIMFLYQVNPLFAGAGASRWRGAFQSVPLIVSFSSFMDESALYADLVLPDHTFLERWVDAVPLSGPGEAMLTLGRPAVVPLYDTRHTGDVLLALARAVGGPLSDALPWADYGALLGFRLQGLFNTSGSIQASTLGEFLSELVKRGVWVGDSYTFGQWDEVLTTPSGRFQFPLNQLELPDSSSSRYYEPPHYAGDEAEYPLHLVPYHVIADAGCRAPNVPFLWEIYGLHIKETWHNWVEINPETARRLGIADGDHVWVESNRGRIRLKARVYEGAMPDVVSIPLGGGHTAGGHWAAQVGGGNVAELVAPQFDGLSGSAAWCATRVKVYK